MPSLSRKEFLTSALSLAALAALPTRSSAQDAPPVASGEFTVEDLKVAQKLAGLTFTDEELKALLPEVKGSLEAFEAMRKQPIPAEVETAFTFHPLPGRRPDPKPFVSVRTSPVGRMQKPAKDEDLAFLSVRELGHLIKTRKLRSTKLTQVCLDRLKRYGDRLLCVVTLLESQALAEAAAADREIAAGHYRGRLHGIPCGVKDLFALRGAPTTWGAGPYVDQMLDYDAAVVERLRAAGAVICAKLSLGALAQGDLWFRGRTKNPWNPAEGSSGSSAGSAAAVAAGLLPFAIGTETLGSIVSPSNRCRVTGFRPTFGRVSRYGAMALCWTMDKVGPICREAEDCALVFAEICGVDARDRSTVDRTFRYEPKTDLRKVKVGYVIGANDDPKDLSRIDREDHLKLLKSLGARLEPVKLRPFPNELLIILEVEAAAAFDELTRSERIYALKDSTWPITFRANRFVGGVEYIAAMRKRRQLMDSFEAELGDFDAIVGTGIGGATIRATNLTGHPQVLIPFGVDDKGAARNVSLVGRLYEDDALLGIANAMQRATGYHRLRPDLSKLP